MERSREVDVPFYKDNKNSGLRVAEFFKIHYPDHFLALFLRGDVQIGMLP